MNSLQKLHTHRQPARPWPSGLWRAAIAALAATSLLAACTWVASASATELASPYGEVSRFGGFDGSGTLPGKFDQPVGFAVDRNDGSTSDHNAVYLLDRVVKEGNRLGYRLQKLSSAGSVLGSVTLPVQEYPGEEGSGANPMISLAVDSSAHRVYALVENMVEASSGSHEFVPVAQRLVAWSTEPNSSKQLVPAPGYPVDELTKAGLVSSALSANGALDAPEGLTVDPSDHNVVIEAQQGVSGFGGGPTILQQVVTEGEQAGQLGSAWTASTDIAPSDEPGTGVFATSAGFGLDLFQRGGKISRLAEVKRNFANPEPSLLAPDKSGGVNFDEAPSLSLEETSASNGAHNLEAQTVYTAGSPVTQLSSGLYAGAFGRTEPIRRDEQSRVEPWEGVRRFWAQDNFREGYLANMGIRLFTSSGTVITTIGGQPQGQACNIDDEQLSVAAGANGSVFVLTQPNRNTGSESDDQVIEFAPGGKGACPQPSGSLTVNGQAGSSFSFPVNTQVTLADSVERKGEAPYRFDWVLVNARTLEVEDLVTQMEAPSYLWPSPSKTYEFTKKGTYYLTATLAGDYGVTLMSPEAVKIKIG